MRARAEENYREFARARRKFKVNTRPGEECSRHEAGLEGEREFSEGCFDFDSGVIVQLRAREKVFAGGMRFRLFSRVIYGGIVYPRFLQSIYNVSIFR